MEEVNKIIDSNSTADQIEAIQHKGSHARLLAGPGTGKTKTITNRVLSLIVNNNIEPSTILLLTFTRLAAAQLKSEMKKVLEPLGKELPQVSTLHSFALRQVLFNSKDVSTLPQPVRIADDWEERNIIQEDLKATLGLTNISEIQDLINQLSTDWETLNIEEAGWEAKFPNPAFLGAFRAHKNQYGETLRAELVYQFKKQLEQARNFKLDREYKHVIVDEYQDLNRCDLVVIHELVNRGAELFVAGDDDQSIYGFRFASPEGIRNFSQTYPDSKKLALEICFRCDKKILEAAEFVAGLDPARLPKPTRPKDNAEDGTVLIVNFQDQISEAKVLASTIAKLIESGTKSDEITILLRSDRNGVITKPIIEALKEKNIDVSLTADSELDNNPIYRIVISYLRLIVNSQDSLAWRTLIQLQDNNLGTECIKAITALAQQKGVRFNEALDVVQADPTLLQKFGQKTATFINETKAVINDIKSISIPSDMVTELTKRFIGDVFIKAQVDNYLTQILLSQPEQNLEGLIKAISSSSEKIEQDTKDNAVNILTMHQAKGLTFDICFIVGAEDEFLPGKNEGEKEGDERRLLYVSMTRARHKLYITYCAKRTGSQKHTGRNSGNEARTLTRFLRDSNIPIKKI